MKVVFKIRSNEIIDIDYENIKGKKAFTPAMKKNLVKLVSAMKNTMVQDFKDFVIDRKELHNTIVITKKL